MSAEGACRSYRAGTQICDDGFPQKPLCAGRAGCPTCGNIKASSLPLCMGDALPSHLILPTGRPRLTRHAGAR